MSITTYKPKLIIKSGFQLACLVVGGVALVPAPALACSKASGCDLVVNYVNPAINLLSVMFGLIAVASLIMGGIQYSASEGDPQKASQAKSRIANTIMAIFAYALLYGFLQFLVPGGFLHRT